MTVTEKKVLRIYTDGACSGNQNDENIGGWGAILEYGQHQKELCGGEVNTTNNRMELMGVIAGLSALKEQCSVTLTTDSKYVCDSITKNWVYGWKKRGWKKSDGKPALKNSADDVLENIDELLFDDNVNFVFELLKH